MSDYLFLVANIIAGTAWLALMIGVARRRRVTNLVRGIGAILAAGYLILFALHAREVLVLVRDYSLPGVQAFFAHTGLALAGWVHYLAFDLWVGAWEVDNTPEAMPRPLVILTLLLTLAVGPIGLCAFLAVRRKWL